MARVIFVNPDTTSDIYTLFSGLYTNNTTVQTDSTELSIEEFQTEVNKATSDNDMIYLVYTDYVTNLTSDSLEDLTAYLVTQITTPANDKIDIFYLTNFMDNCINRVELQSQPSDADHPLIKNYSFTFTTAPNGLACAATTKSKWTSILSLAQGQAENNLSAKISALVMNEKIIAATSQPLFAFPDLMKQTDPLDVLKTQYCRLEKNFGRSVPNTENLSLFWFICGATIVVFSAWVLSYYRPDNKLLLLRKY